MEINQYNGMTLAYIGDAIYELCIRQYVLNSNETKVKQLHKKVTKLVNSSAQAKFIHYLLNKNILTDEEKNIYLRGRNAKVNSNRKNVDLAIYHEATGFEALCGYLYLLNRKERLDYIIKLILSEEEEHGF